MVDYGYLNTRVRAMRSRLFRRVEFGEILDVPDLRSMVDRLLDSPYADELAVSLRTFPPLRAVEDALQTNMQNAFDRIRKFAGQSGEALLFAIAESWDIRCLKTLLRAIHRKLHPDEIVELAEPGVQLRRNQIEQLAGEPDLAGVVALLQSWSMPWGDVLQPFIRDHRHTSNLRPLEFALDQHRIRSAAQLQGLGSTGRRLLQEFLWAEAEIANISTCLVNLQSDDKPQLLDQGDRSRKLISRLHDATTYDEVVNIFSESPYRSIFDRALPSLMRKDRTYAVLERLLDEALLQQTARIALLDPLGVAVAYHYLRCKRNEVMNLRLIARGLGNGLPRNMVRLSLVFAPESAA